MAMHAPKRRYRKKINPVRYKKRCKTKRSVIEDISTSSSNKYISVSRPKTGIMQGFHIPPPPVLRDVIIKKANLLAIGRCTLLTEINCFYEYPFTSVQAIEMPR